MEQKDKKYPCKDCRFCQWCSDERCRVCRPGITDSGCRAAPGNSQCQKKSETDHGN